MRGGWRVIIIHPEHEQAASLASTLAVDARFQCRTFTHIESALEYLDTETQDAALVPLRIEIEDGVLLSSSIQERQAHLPIVTLRNDDQAQVRADALANIIWPCATETLISALEMAIEIPTEERTQAIGMPAIALCARDWSSQKKRVNLAKTRESPTLTQTTNDKSQSFACYWLIDAEASLCAATINDSIQAAEGRVLELDLGSQPVCLAAQVPASICPRELIASLIGETTAYLFRRPAHLLSENEQRQFLTFAAPQAVETRAMTIATS